MYNEICINIRKGTMTNIIVRALTLKKKNQKWCLTHFAMKYFMYFELVNRLTPSASWLDLVAQTIAVSLVYGYVKISLKL